MHTVHIHTYIHIYIYVCMYVYIYIYLHTERDDLARGIILRMPISTLGVHAREKNMQSCTNSFWVPYWRISEVFI